MPSYPGLIGDNSLVVQHNGINNCIYLFNNSLSKSKKNVVNGYIFDLSTKKWSNMDIQIPLNVEKSYASGADNIYLCNKDGISCYHTITNTLYQFFEWPDIKNILNLIFNHNSFVIFTVEKNNKISIYHANILPHEKSFGLINIIVLILYFLLLAFIGFFFSRRQKNTDDYFKGGGRIPWWAAGLSLFGTALSAITFMAIPSKSYFTNWSYALFNTGIFLVAPIIVYVFIPFFRKLNITTAYEYLEIRFNSVIRTICSFAFILFQIGRMGIVLFLPSIALNVVTGIDIFLCIGIMGVFSILYTMIGGIEAVVWTDAIQVIILLGGAIFAVIYISCSMPGGFYETVNIAFVNNKFSLGSCNLNLKESTIWTMLIAACFTNLTTYGTDQSMVQRYLTTSSIKEAKKSVWTNAFLVIPTTIIFFFIGTALFSYYKIFPEELSVTISNNDAIFPWYIFTNLPEGIIGLLIAGIFAAAMSTLSGSMNSTATAYFVDIRPKLFHKNKLNYSDLKQAKIATCIVGIISLSFALLMATWNISSLWDEFNKILGLILGSMGGLFLLGMLTKRANSQGALIGIVFSLIIQLLVANFHTLHLLLYTASGFISCFVIGYISSFFFSDKK